MMRHALVSTLAAGLALSASLAPAAFAQNFDPYRGVINENLRRTDGSIRLCIYQHNYLSDFETAVAQELAEALLIEVDVEMLAEEVVERFELDNFIPYTEDELYAVMTLKLCDGFMGLVFRTDYQQWMHVTTPYLTTRNVFAVHDARYAGLLDIDRSLAIGGRLGSRGDADFLTYWTTLPADARWLRYMYPDTRTALDRLLDGTVAGAFISEAALAYAYDGHPETAGIRIATTPFVIGNSEYGILVRSSDVYVRTILDDGIADLVASGRIEELKREYNLTLP